MDVISFREAVQFIFQVGFDIFRPLRKPRHVKRPQIYAAQEIFTETTVGHIHLKVTVRAAYELKIALRFNVGADGKKFFFFNGAKQH